MSVIAFIDTETLGLDPDRHAIWEVGMVLYDTDQRCIMLELEEQIWLTEEEIAAGDPVGMEIGGFNTRYDPDLALPRDDVMSEVIGLTAGGVHLAGAVPSFDEERLRRLALSLDLEPGWHYHLIDVENIAIGYLLAARKSWTTYEDWTWPLPWKSDPLLERLGVSISEEDRHTALGDARWAMRVYEKLTE